MSGSCGSDGRLHRTGKYGYRWSASSGGTNDARGFGFDEDRGELDRHYRYSALPVRPVLK